jgi:hypothetical protein
MKPFYTLFHFTFLIVKFNATVTHFIIFTVALNSITKFKCLVPNDCVEE